MRRSVSDLIGLAFRGSLTGKTAKVLLLATWFGWLLSSYVVTELAFSRGEFARVGLATFMRVSMLNMLFFCTIVIATYQLLVRFKWVSFVGFLLCGLVAGGLLALATALLALFSRWDVWSPVTIFMHPPITYLSIWVLYLAGNQFARFQRGEDRG